MRFSGRLTPEDMALVDTARTRLGIRSVTETLRVALRSLARELYFHVDRSLEPLEPPGPLGDECGLRSLDRPDMLTAVELGATEEQYRQAVRVSLLNRAPEVEAEQDGLYIIGGCVELCGMTVHATFRVALPF